MNYKWINQLKNIGKKIQCREKTQKKIRNYKTRWVDFNW